MDHPTSYDVFISYSSKDRVWVSSYVQALQACGLNVWWDRSLLAGQSYHKDIQKALDQSSCVITIWSKAAVDSQWVLAESEQAYKRDVIIPVSCALAPRIPVPFSSLHTIDLSQWNGEIDDLCFQQALFPIRQTLHRSTPRKYLGNANSTKNGKVSRKVFLSLIFIIVAISIFFLPKIIFTPLPNEKEELSVDTSTVEKNEMQTDFAKKVEVKHGLERGVEGNKAKHQSMFKNQTTSFQNRSIGDHNETGRLSDISHSVIVYEEKDIFLENNRLSEQEGVVVKWPSDIDQPAKNVGTNSAQPSGNNINRSNSLPSHSHNGREHSHLLHSLNHQHGQTEQAARQENESIFQVLSENGSSTAFLTSEGLVTTLHSVIPAQGAEIQKFSEIQVFIGNQNCSDFERVILIGVIPKMDLALLSKPKKCNASASMLNTNSYKSSTHKLMLYGHPLSIPGILGLSAQRYQKNHEN